jgi:hypothetical protein
MQMVSEEPAWLVDVDVPIKLQAGTTQPKLRAGARLAARPSALGGRIKRATSTRGTRPAPGAPPARRAENGGQSQSYLYGMCCACLWGCSHVLCTHTKLERMVCV